jgi:uncharacterized membrane protein (TIGR02234 family)
MSDRYRRREMIAALVLLVVGAIVGLVAMNLPWGRAYLAGGDTVVVPGRAVAPHYLALPLFALAAAVAVLATRTVGRIMIGAVLAVAAVVGAYAALWFGFGSDPIRDWAEATGHDVLGASGPTSDLNWYIIACAQTLLAGLWIAARGMTWPTLGRRYERQSAAEPSTSRHAWDALDRGEDPTASL